MDLIYVCIYMYRVTVNRLESLVSQDGVTDDTETAKSILLTCDVTVPSDTYTIRWYQPSTHFIMVCLANQFRKRIFLYLRRLVASTVGTAEYGIFAKFFATMFIQMISPSPTFQKLHGVLAPSLSATELKALRAIDNQLIEKHNQEASSIHSSSIKSCWSFK
jgi:hypothetical protein